VTRKQLSIPEVGTFPRAAAAREEVDRAGDQDRFELLHTALEKVLHALGRKTLAYELDVQPSQLTEAFAGEHKQLQLRWLPTFVRLCPAELRPELRDALDAMFDDEQPLSPEEEADARAEALAEFGPQGQRALETARQRRRRRRGAKRG
jgi:hypothetical protein